MSTLRRPTPSKFCRTVVSGGQKLRDSAMSSNPTTLTSPGTLRPVSCIARSTPRAIWSLAVKTAVTSGFWASARPAW